MDDVQNRFARELADAIAAAVAASTAVESCRERAREAGFDLRVTLEATVGFATRPGPAATESPAVADREPKHLEITANDRRFLRSLRIAADEVKVEEAN
ncbi:MAG: hypothetical protein AB7U83_05665 [Vicinamibacterales bacterium]